jgi:hypothetical protein
MSESKEKYLSLNLVLKVDIDMLVYLIQIQKTFKKKRALKFRQVSYQ